MPRGLAFWGHPGLAVVNFSFIEKLIAYKSAGATSRSYTGGTDAMLATMLHSHIRRLGRGGGSILPGLTLGEIAGDPDVMDLFAFRHGRANVFGIRNVPGLAAATPGGGYPYIGQHPAGHRGGGGVIGAGVLPGDVAGAGVIGAGLGAVLDNLGVALRAAGRYDDAVTAHQTAVTVFGYLAARAAVFDIRNVPGLVTAANVTDAYTYTGLHPAWRSDRGRATGGSILPGAGLDAIIAGDPDLPRLFTFLHSQAADFPIRNVPGLVTAANVTDAYTYTGLHPAWRSDRGRGTGGSILPGADLDAIIAGDPDLPQLFTFLHSQAADFPIRNVPGLVTAATGVGGYPHAGPHHAGHRGGGGVIAADMQPGDVAGAGVIGAGLAAALDNLGVALRAAGRYTDAVTAHQTAVTVFGYLAARAAVFDIRNVSGLVTAANAVADTHTGQHPARRPSRGHAADGSTLPGAGLDAILVILLGLPAGQRGVNDMMTTTGIVPVVYNIADLDLYGAVRPGGIGMATADRSPGQLEGAGVIGARLAAALDNLGIALRAAGRYTDAVTAHQTAVTVFGRIKDGRGEAMALENLEKTRAEELASSSDAY